MFLLFTICFLVISHLLVSMEDIDGAIKRVLDPGNVVITLVSKAEDILEEAKALGVVELKEP